MAWDGGVSAFLHTLLAGLFPFGGGWGLSEPSPFWSRERSHTPFPHAILPSFHPSLPSSFPSFSPYFVAFRSPVFSTTTVSPSASCFPLVHSFTRRNKTNPRENQRRNKEHPIVNISFNCFSNSPLLSGRRKKIPSQPLYSCSGKRARSFFPCPSKVAAFGYILP